MNKRYLIIGAGGALALYLVLSREESFGNEDFTAGYTAGFFTPGPFTVLAITGLVAYHA